jgi:hypothetical protein
VSRHDPSLRLSRTMSFAQLIVILRKTYGGYADTWIRGYVDTWIRDRKISLIPALKSDSHCSWMNIRVTIIREISLGLSERHSTHTICAWTWSSSWFVSRPVSVIIECTPILHAFVFFRAREHLRDSGLSSIIMFGNMFSFRSQKCFSFLFITWNCPEAD